MTLQVLDERWLLGRLLPVPLLPFAVFLAGTRTSSFAWALVIWVLASLVAWRLGRSIQMRLGPPRLRVLRREHPARPWLRHRLSWLYRQATSDWSPKH